MFQKPAFGASTSGFGSFSSGATTSSPFGFKPTAGTSAFGAAPAFGATATSQPAATGGLFGATNNTTGGLFGNTNATPAPAFGATTSTFGSTFGSTPTTGGGLFGTNQNQAAGGLFGNTQNNSAFGAKPAGFGFGATPANNTSGGGLFGSTPAPSGGLFGQQTNTLGGGGLFGSPATTSFGQQQQQPTGTGHVKYNPVTGTDVVVKNGTSQNVSIKHLCITCMKEYENKCLEELRLEDYIAGRKGPSQTGFGGFQATENKPLFGGTTSFGQPATTSASNVFGGGGLGTSTFGQTSTFSFGGNTQTNTPATNLFGANKPAFGATSTAGTIGTGLFGTTTTTQAAPAFGASTATFGFGANANQQQGGLFGAKPAATGVATTGFGSFGNTGGVFAPNKPATNTGFGATPLGFGTSTANTGGLFGGGTFGKPNTTQPAFGLTQTPALGAGLGAATNPLQAKPTGFGTLGGGTMFQQPQTNTFNTGLNTSLGGGGLFGNSNNTLGTGLGGLGGMPTNTGFNNTGPGSMNNTAVHEQILTAMARPYAGSALFKDLLPETSTTAEDVLKPTNPAAVKAALDKSQYKLTSPAQTLKLRPRALGDKKSLFDGLEEADASLEDKLSLKPSRKRLVLRPRSYNRENSDPLCENRSLEENREITVTSPLEREREIQNNAQDKDRNNLTSDKEERRPFAENNHFDASSDRHGSWMTSPQQQIWNSKEIQANIEQTPRIYPQLDKELPDDGPERRASWLTTKPLRKPQQTNADSESSVRELIRNDYQRQKDIQQSREKSMEASPERLSITEEEQPTSRHAPNPAGVVLTRPGYYTIPTLDDMIGYIRPDGRCVLPNFTIGRRNYGNVYFDCEIDVTGLDLDSLVHFLNKEVIIYPDDTNKPPVGEGLNRRAIVTLDRIWPRDKTDKNTITSPDRLLKMDYEGKLRRVCDKHDTKFIEYRPQTGSWVFRVEHFSKYGLTDSDEEDDIIPDVMKRQIAHQQLQKAAPIPPPKPVQSPGLGGLGGLGGLAVSTTPGVLSTMDDRLFNTSLNLMNGSGKGFEMDTTENTELQSMYTDLQRAFGVKSPTSELAKLEHRHTHNVQLMKASLYADAEMEEDDTSVSTHDQQVPTLGLSTIQRGASPPPPSEVQPLLIDVKRTSLEHIDVDQPMKPLIVQPKTVVLHHHRKIPPFRNTISGRVDAKFIADMQLCRSRHSRVGFGPGSSLAYVTSYNSISKLPKNADLCDIGSYMEGRSDNDWSGQVVATIKIANTNIQETLSKHIEALLEHSRSEHKDSTAPFYFVSDKLSLLKEYVQIAEKSNTDVKFGVTSSYCLEVWKLCEALWGADLENDEGLPATDAQSIVQRYRLFLKWITEAVSKVTDESLTESKTAEIEDDTDYHSARIWTLLLGGRTIKACQLAAEHGDLNMCAIIAQGGADPLQRSLISRQLSTWRDCGATSLVSSHRIATLQLLSGMTPRCIADTHWIAALSATARYLCQQVPSLEQIIRKYESLFKPEADNEDDKEIDITVEENIEMQLPSPPHMDDYEFEVIGDKKPRKILDLRYELIRARAFNSRPKIQTASYTPDPLDYSLCFLLNTWFGTVTDDVCASFASQLEENGDWHLAVACLCYMPCDKLRSNFIRGVLSRNVPSEAVTTVQKNQIKLIDKLNIPAEWVYIAMAHRAKYEHKPLIEAEHLAAAQQWEAAHNVLMEDLFANAVLSDDLQPIKPLIEKLNDAASQSLVPDWEKGGKSLYHYIILCNEILDFVNDADVNQAEVNDKIKTLRPHVVALCNSLSHLKPSGGSVMCAVGEMWSRVSRLGAAPQLHLPPDTTHAHYLQMLSEICERA